MSIMAQDTNLSTLNGMFKYITGDGPINVIPKYAKLLKAIPFEKAKQLGRSFIFPVIVSDEQGITFNSDGSAFALNAGVSYQTEEASVVGTEIMTRGTISVKSVAAGMSDKQSFGNTLALKAQRMIESHTRAAEMQLLYGGLGLGNATSKANTSATTTTLTISDATWSDGTWAGSTNMKLNFYANDNATLISSGADAVFTVTEVNYANKTLLVTGTATGTTALQGATYTGAGLYIYRDGAFGKEMVGLKKILTTSGNLFGINNTTYELWKSNSETISGALNFQKILDSTVRAVGRGLSEDLTVYISPKQWNTLASDAASLRRLDSSYQKTKFINGVDALEFYAANGKLTIEAHPMVRNGDMFMVPLDRFKRVGAKDISFDQPGGKGSGEYWFPMQSYAGYELRTYSDFAIICEAPARCIYGSGFTA